MRVWTGSKSIMCNVLTYNAGTSEGVRKGDETRKAGKSQSSDPHYEDKLMEKGIERNPSSSKLRSMWLQAKKDLSPDERQYQPDILRGLVNRKTGEHFWAPAKDIYHEDMKDVVSPASDYYDDPDDKFHRVYVGWNGEVTAPYENTERVKQFMKEKNVPITANVKVRR